MIEEWFSWSLESFPLFKIDEDEALPVDIERVPALKNPSNVREFEGGSP